MSLFQKASSTSAYLKMGVLGFAGSGKTHTATLTAIGLVHYMREHKLDVGNRPIFFLDTETGSDWVKPMIEGAGIDLFTAKTRAFSDLLKAVEEAKGGASVMLIDSISHFWKELCDSYAKVKKRSRGLEFQDWNYLKGEWAKFTDAFINHPLHIVLCGRAGYEYDFFENDNGKKELEKTGIKMKAESEMGYEPSLLVLMERGTDMATNKVHRTAYILKDRSNLIDGHAFHNPNFVSFLPHIEFLNLGGVQLGVDTSRTSEHSIPNDAGKDYGRVQREICADEIQSLITLKHPGQSSEEKRTKIMLLRKHFRASWTEIEKVMPLFDMRAGYDSLHRELEGVPSRYTAPPPPVEKANGEAEDTLPDFANGAEPPPVASDLGALLQA